MQRYRSRSPISRKQHYIEAAELLPLADPEPQPDPREFIPWYKSWKIGETINSPRLQQWLELHGEKSDKD